MFNKINKDIRVIIGKLNSKNEIYTIFDKKIILFLNEISKEILKNREYRQFPDLIAFGFWCRLSNINSIFQKYNFFKNRFGRGSILHISPSNVPTTFAYSMVFGLLSGNFNIVRLPSKNYFQIEILCKIFKKLSQKKSLKKIFNRFSLIRYENSDLISSELSKNVDGRIIWGGDRTVNKFKTFATKPRCVDIYFADKYSVSLIESNKLAKLNNRELKIMVQKFYNDTYTMDQYGCSSPTSVFWLGKNNQAKKNFWNELATLVNNKYNFDFSGANKKITNIMDYVLKKKVRINLGEFNLIKFQGNKQEFNQFKDINFGTFLEIDLASINHFKNFTSEKLQTVTYYGVEFERIKKFIFQNKIKGIDRIVPIGRAFELTSIWDGIDIIATLSRTISD